LSAAGFEGLANRVNGDTALVWHGRYLNVYFLVVDGDEPYWISIRDGRIVDVAAGDALLRPWRFKIRASRDAWRAFWQPMPRPGFHDIFAMCKAGHATVEGDLQPLMANLRYIKDVLATPRELAGDHG
jgi:hypothetical protein